MMVGITRYKSYDEMLKGQLSRAEAINTEGCGGVTIRQATAEDVDRLSDELRAIDHHLKCKQQKETQQHMELRKWAIEQAVCFGSAHQAEEVIERAKKIMAFVIDKEGVDAFSQ